MKKDTIQLVIILVVLAAAAYSYFCLAAFYWVIDVRGWRKWSFFFRVIGMNSITIYLLMHIVGFRGISSYFFSGIAGLGSDPTWNTFVITAGQVAVEWVLLLVMYKKGLFLKV